MIDLIKMTSNRKAGVLCGSQGGGVINQNWDDDTEYHRAESRAWVMVGVASWCAVAVVGFVAIAVLGGGVFMTLVNVLSK